MENIVRLPSRVWPYWNGTHGVMLVTVPTPYRLTVAHCGPVWVCAILPRPGVPRQDFPGVDLPARTFPRRGSPGRSPRRNVAKTTFCTPKTFFIFLKKEFDTAKRRESIDGLMKNTQKRASVGGERGANGEWYEGGKFIATTPKRNDHSNDIFCPL